MVVFTYVTRLVSNEIFEILRVTYICVWVYLLVLWGVRDETWNKEDTRLMLVKM